MYVEVVRVVGLSYVFIRVDAEVNQQVDDALVFVEEVAVVLERGEQLEVLLQQFHAVLGHVGVVRADGVVDLFLGRRLFRAAALHYSTETVPTGYSK